MAFIVKYGIMNINHGGDGIHLCNCDNCYDDWGIGMTVVVRKKEAGDQS